MLDGFFVAPVLEVRSGALGIELGNSVRAAPSLIVLRANLPDQEERTYGIHHFLTMEKA